MIDQTEPLEIGIAQPLGDGTALLEVILGGVEQLAVGADHAEVVIRERAAVLIAGFLAGLEGAPVADQRFLHVALDVGENAEVLLHARTQRLARAAQGERLEEGLARLVQQSRLEVEHAERVERLGGEDGVAGVARDVVAAVAQLPRGVGIVPVVAQHREPPQRLREDRRVPGPLGRDDRGLVALHRLRQAPRLLLPAGLVQQIGGGAPAAHRQRCVTRQRRTPRSGGSVP